MSDEGIQFDEQALQKLYAVGGDDLVIRMIDLFTRLMPERIENARLALAERDLPTLERHLHSTKSSAANVGAMRLRDLAAEGEQLAPTLGDDPTALQDLLSRVESEYLAIARILRAEADRRSR